MPVYDGTADVETMEAVLSQPKAPGSLLLDERTAAPVIAELQRRHHVVEIKDRFSSGAAPVLIRLYPSGMIEAGADPYFFRSSQAW